ARWDQVPKASTGQAAPRHKQIVQVSQGPWSRDRGVHPSEGCH
ncbi:hypothetical protein A2U01_0102998, partial [Trifolium medium]|nr:hypothetical protein [Trifolium medium]